MKLEHWLEFWGKKTGLDLDYFVKNGLWMLVRQIVEVIIGIGLFSVFARVATQETFGYYQFSMSLFAIVSILSLPGMNTAVLRETARGYDGEYREAVRKSFLWSLLGIPVIILIGGYYLWHGDQVLAGMLLIISFLFPFFFAPNTWSSFLQGKHRYKEFSVWGAIQTLVGAGVTILAIFFDNNNALLIVTTYLLAYSLLNVFYYYKTLVYVDNVKSSGEGIKYGLFLTKINLFNFIAEHIDKVIIGTLLSPVALAIFSIVLAIPSRLKMITKALLSITFPKMSQDTFRVAEFFHQKQGKITFWLFVMVSVVGGAVYFFTIIPISRLIFGESYSDYYQYGQYLTIFVLTHIPLLLTNWYMQAKKMSQAIMYVNLIHVIVKVVLIVIGVKLWGIVGGIWMFNLSTVFFLAIQVIAIVFEEKKLKTV